MQLRLNKIKKIKYYFIAEIIERETMSKALSNYFAVFDYFDKTLIVLFATGGSVSIVSFAADSGAQVGITCASI